MFKRFKKTKLFKKVFNRLFKDEIFEFEDRGYQNALSYEKKKSDYYFSCLKSLVVNKPAIIIQNHSDEILVGIIKAIETDNDDEHLIQRLIIANYLDNGVITHTTGRIVRFSFKGLYALLKLSPLERRSLFFSLEETGSKLKDDDDLNKKLNSNKYDRWYDKEFNNITRRLERSGFTDLIIDQIIINKKS